MDKIDVQEILLFLEETGCDYYDWVVYSADEFDAFYNVDISILKHYLFTSQKFFVLEYVINVLTFIDDSLDEEIIDWFAKKINKELEEISLIDLKKNLSRSILICLKYQGKKYINQVLPILHNVVNSKFNFANKANAVSIIRSWIGCDNASMFVKCLEAEAFIHLLLPKKINIPDLLPHLEKQNHADCICEYAMNSLSRIDQTYKDDVPILKSYLNTSHKYHVLNYVIAALTQIGDSLDEEIIAWLAQRMDQEPGGSRFYDLNYNLIGPMLKYLRIQGKKHKEQALPILRMVVIARKFSIVDKINAFIIMWSWLGLSEARKYLKLQ